MDIIFFYAPKNQHEVDLAYAFQDGTPDSVNCVLAEKTPYSHTRVELADVVCFFGVKSAKMFHRALAENVTVVYFDKGYSRSRLNSMEYYRVAVNAQNAADFVGRANHKDDRFEKLEWKLRPYDQGTKNYILFAGSSRKYHNIHRLPHPTQYARECFKEIKKYSPRPIIYRPKPSWVRHQDCVQIEGTTFSGPERLIRDVFRDTYVLVTHGSNACVDAMVHGIPSVIIGCGVSRSISSTQLSEVNNPIIPLEDERYQLMSNLAYCQWKLEEIASGEAWQTHIYPEITRAQRCV